MERQLFPPIVLVAAISACAPPSPEDLTPNPRYPPEGARTSVSAEESREAVRTMTIWLENFRDEQRRYKETTGRYADDVTVDGEIQPLPPPFRTSYSVHQLGWRYVVQVRHPGARRTCKLEDGEDALYAGRIICTQQ